MRPIYLSIPLLRRLSDIVERNDNWPVTDTPANDESLQEAASAVIGADNDFLVNGWRPETSLSSAEPRKSFSTARLLFVLTLLLTGAAVMKILAMVNRRREFHPNGQPRRLDERISFVQRLININ
jgi:hypothetical protein